MNKDIFISYSNKDRAFAEHLLTSLEEAGLKCFIAPRDILPSKPYHDEIKKGIQCATILLYLFSENSDNSEHVLNELQLVIDLSKPIIPIRLEERDPNRSAYFIKRLQWIDALPPPPTDHIHRLSQKIKQVVEALDCERDGKLSNPELATNILYKRYKEYVGIPSICAHFIGHSELITSTVSNLGKSQAVLLFGPRGIGKSELAKAIAHNWLQSRPNALGVFVDCYDITADLGFRQILFRALGLSFSDISYDNILLNYISTAPGIILVFDNYDNALQYDRDGAVGTMSKLMSAFQEMRFIITSLSNMTITGAESTVRIPQLSQNESATLINNILFAQNNNTPNIDLDGDDDMAIIKMLDGLPLAVIIASNLLQKMPKREFINIWTDKLSHIRSDIYSSEDPFSSLKIALKLTEESLSRQAIIIATIISLFPTGVDYDVLIEISPFDKQITSEAIISLGTKSLLINVSQYRLRLLGPAMDYFRAQIEANDVYKSIPVALNIINRRLAQNYHKIYSLDYGEITDSIFDEILNITELSRFAIDKNIDINLYGLTSYLALYARAAGITQGVVPFLENAAIYFAKSKKIGYQARTSLEVGHLMRGIPDLDAADNQYVVATELAIGMDDHELAAIASLRRADVLRMKGLYSDAIMSCKFSKSQIDTLSSAPILLRADLIETIGDIERSSGSWDAAISKYNEARSMYEELEFGMVGIINTLNSAGDVLFSLQHLNESEDNYNGALETSEAVGDKQGSLNAKLGLAKIEILKNNYSRSHELADFLLEGYKHIGDKLGYGNSLLLKGRIFNVTGDIAKAIEYFLSSKYVFDKINCKLNSAISDMEIRKAKNISPKSPLLRISEKTFGKIVGRKASMEEILIWPLERKGSIFLTTEVKNDNI